MMSLLCLCIVLVGLALCYGQGGTISFRLNTYINPGGKGDNGNCCDGIFPVCKKSSQCDQYFNICFDDPESDNDDMSVCPLGTYTTGIIELNEITFGAMIDSTPNPKELTFNNAWPYNVKIKVQVWDEDGTDWLGRNNDNDFVDYIYTIQSIHPDGHANEITISGRTTLVATIIVNCNNDGMSDDCITSLPPSATEPPHRLPIQCYECSTSDMTTMEPEYITAWEQLTKRDMSYIEISPQCQDVGAVPDQYLQNCEGVCLTGLWDVDQDFIFRTCVAVTEDCNDLDDSEDPTATYYCSSESKGNNDRHLIEGVQLPETDPGFEPEPTVDTAPQRPPIQCYECATTDMTLMDQSYITGWEILTLRSMSDVVVTPQCQDVAATPIEYLQPCDGVCLTGLWDQEQDFIFRTCVAVTYDCSDLESDPSSDASYYCSTESKGNDDKHLVEGVQLPETDIDVVDNNDEVVEPTIAQDIVVADIIDELVEPTVAPDIDVADNNDDTVEQELIEEDSHIPIQCYECATRDIALMDPNLITSWESLTMRSMSDVAVTPQCQDVAATPDQYLQPCNGVCMTGLWDQEQDFIFRTCIAVTRDCNDLESPSFGSTYHCFTETRGNNDKHLIEGVPLPPSYEAAAKAGLTAKEADLTTKDDSWINCFSCSSKSQAGCKNPTKHVNTVNCTLPTDAILDSQSGVKCAKTVTIEGNHETVERGCAYSSKSHCSYHGTSSGAYVKECYCNDKHKCNGAVPHHFSFSTFLIATTVYLIQFYIIS